MLHMAWGLAAAVFLTVGWTAMQAWDPKGPVSLLTHGNPTAMMIEVLALAAITSAVATVVAGRRYPDVGAFAVGIALALVSVRGDTMTYLLLEQGGCGTLCAKLIAEGLFWSVTMATALLVAAIIVRWIAPHEQLLAGDRGSGTGRTPTLGCLLSRMAAPALPIVSHLVPGAGSSGQSEDRSVRLKHIFVVVVAALVLTRVLASGAPDRAIHHGQVCFAVWVGFYVAAGRAQAMFPVRSSLWSWSAVPIVCVSAYGFAWMMSLDPAPGHLPSVPLSGFLRVLPITYVALGTSAVLLARWRLLAADADRPSA